MSWISAGNASFGEDADWNRKTPGKNHLESIKFISGQACPTLINEGEREVDVVLAMSGFEVFLPKDLVLRDKMTAISEISIRRIDFSKSDCSPHPSESASSMYGIWNGSSNVPVMKDIFKDTLYLNRKLNTAFSKIEYDVS
ncbi:hypothetical protein Tco_0045282 [Tanacetum coccineum]